MSLWKIAWRSIEQRSLASALTAISMALGVMLVVAVLVIHGVVADSFRRNSGLGYNIIVGAKGGKLQLVLNTVFYLSSPVENIPYSFYQEFAKEGGKFQPWVERAIPVCLGDYYREYRVVGTTPAMFDGFEYSRGRKYEFASGRNFKHENFFEAVIGSVAAYQTGLKAGDTFQPSHAAPDGAKHEPFTIVGVLAPTGTPNDRALFVNMEGFYLLEGHARPAPKKDDAEPDASDKGAVEPKDDADHALGSQGPEGRPQAEQTEKHGDHEHQHHEPLPEEQREVTAILVRTTNDFGALALVNPINEGPVGQAVMPISEITKLFANLVNPIQIVLLALTVLIVLVSGISILVSIYNSMSERRHEIAVIRALGAGRMTVMLIVLFESILLSVGGGLLGWFFGHFLIGVLTPWITNQTGVTLGFFHYVPYELVIIPGLVLLASLVGYLPAMTAYRTDVAKALSEAP